MSAMLKPVSRAMFMAACAWGVALPAALGQDVVSLAYLQGKLPVATDAMATLGPDLFGDRINLFNGSFSFEQTDLELPGNSALPVALVRQHTPGRSWRVRGAMADWDLHTPRIEGTFAAAEGWVPAFGSSANRCSGFNSPPTVSRGSTDFLPHEYWHGTHLAIPGHGSQELLPRRAGNVLAPTNGNADPLVALYRLVTRNNWQIRCLATLKNAPGEGFVALSPDGVRYSFDWMASRSQTTLRKGAVLTRSDMYLMATSVVDRFGNEVKYTYDDANPLNLTEIKSSDGRIITLAYAAGRVSTVSDGTRTWQYLYSPQGDLQTVQLPDGSRWSFNLRPLFYDGALLLGEFADCDSLADAPIGQFVGAITHPSGATGTFTTRFLTQGRTNVQRACTYVSGSTWTNGSVWPRSTSNQALTAKQISGPGMAAMNWAYNAGSGDPWGEWTCTSCPDRKTVTVTEPSGAVTRHTFGIRWHGNEGQLLRVEQGPVGSAALSTTDFSYRDAGGQAYADGFGDSVYLLSDWLSTRNRPQDSRVTTQQGVVFTWAVDAASAGFDTQARPLKVNKFSDLGYSKTETTTYADNTALWVMGQEASVADSYGRLMRSATYDNPATALPTAKYSFGRLLESLNYWPDGTVKQRIDPVGRITALSNYKRGLPQNVTHRDGATESAVVHNIGKVTEYTNAASTTTKFDYDLMGRIARVDHPNEPNLQYHPTFNTFEPVPYAEHGLPPGHWRQITTTGNAITMRWYDAMWRVRLMQSWDVTDGPNTSKMVEYRYDHEGKKTFQAYAQRGISPVDQTTIAGTWRKYDVLDRPVEMRQTSELQQGDLVSTTEYLPGFQRKVTNPRGLSTTFQFQAFDTPSEDHISGVLAPETVWTAIYRDIHGMPDSIVRGGSYAGANQQATRSYVYDSYRRLCKTTEPETGATVQGYDIAGNVVWRASGLALPADGCEDAAVPPNKRINFSYDARDRLAATTHGDGTSVITRASPTTGC